MELKHGSLCPSAIRESLQQTVQESSFNKYIPELFGSQTGNCSRKLWLVPVCAFSRFPMTPPFCCSLFSNGFLPLPLVFFSSPPLSPSFPIPPTPNSLITQRRRKKPFTTTGSGRLLPTDPLAVTVGPRVPACLCFPCK